MRTSESTKELVGALAKAQAEFPKIVKDSENPFFKSKYADLSSIVNAVQDTLGKQGLAVTQHLETDFQTYFDEDGTVKGEKLLLCVVTRLEHTSGEFEESTLRVPLLDAKPQTLGSASTYIRRYALQSILRVAAEVDDDANAASLNENWSKEKRAQYVEQKKAQLAPVPKPEPVPDEEHAAKANLKKQLEASIKDLDAKIFEPEPSQVAAKPPAKREDPGLISDIQVRMVWVIAQKRGLSDGDVRGMVDGLGYQSLRDLPRSKVDVLLAELDPEYKFHSHPRQAQ